MKYFTFCTCKPCRLSPPQIDRSRYPDLFSMGQHFPMQRKTCYPCRVVGPCLSRVLEKCIPCKKGNLLKITVPVEAKTNEQRK